MNGDTEYDRVEAMNRMYSRNRMIVGNMLCVFCTTKGKMIKYFNIRWYLSLTQILQFVNCYVYERKATPLAESTLIYLGTTILNVCKVGV